MRGQNCQACFEGHERIVFFEQLLGVRIGFTKHRLSPKQDGTVTGVAASVDDP